MSSCTFRARVGESKLITRMSYGTVRARVGESNFHSENTFWV